MIFSTETDGTVTVRVWLLAGVDHACGDRERIPMVTVVDYAFPCGRVEIHVDRRVNDVRSGDTRGRLIDGQ